MDDAGPFASPVKLKVSQAAKAVGRARSTLNRDIANGKVSITRNGTGQPFIELCELERAYGRVDIRTLSEGDQMGHRDQAAADSGTADSLLLRQEIEFLRERLSDKDAVIADLKQQRDREAEERRRLTAILADRSTVSPPAPMPAPASTKRWWRFGR